MICVVTEERITKGEQRALSLDIWPVPTIGSVCVDDGSFYINNKYIQYFKLGLTLVHPISR